MSATKSAEPLEKASVWTPTNVQFLYRHRNGRYYVRTFAGGKEKWASMKTTLLSVAKNRMKEHVDASERLKSSGEAQSASGSLTFGAALKTYRERLGYAEIRPNTKSYRESGIKLILKTWKDVEEINVRKITSPMVEDWLRRFCSTAKPHIPNNAKTAARNSTGASVTTIKCALDAVRHILDIAVEAGHLYANPARNSTVAGAAKSLLKQARRTKAEQGGLILPTKEEFIQLVAHIRNAGVAECRAAADYVEFIAFSGSRKNEATNVLWRDADFSRGKVRLRVTKNGEIRFVPMIAEMRALLHRLKKERPTAQPEDTVLLVKEAQGFISTACTKLGIARFTTHALRHLFGTACLEAGVDVRTVAEWLGHKDQGALLLKIYSHIRQDHENEMVQKVSFSRPAA